MDVSSQSFISLATDVTASKDRQQGVDWHILGAALLDAFDLVGRDGRRRSRRWSRISGERGGGIGGGAEGGVALTAHGEVGGARDAAVGSVDFDGAVADLLAGATGLVAVGPLAPGGELAVNGRGRRSRSDGDIPLFPREDDVFIFLAPTSWISAALLQVAKIIVWPVANDFAIAFVMAQLLALFDGFPEMAADVLMIAVSTAVSILR